MKDDNTRGRAGQDGGQGLPAGDMARASWQIKLIRLLLRGFFSLAFRVRLVGQSNFPRRQVIVTPNHLLWIDTFLLLLFLPVEPRIYVLGRADEVLKTGFRRTIIDAVGVLVPLDYDSPVKAMRTMRDVLNRGGSLLIFPEGAVQGSREGDLLPLQHGAAHLSLSSGVPLLPVGLTGTRDIWLRKKLIIRIGKPLDPAAFASGDKRGRVEALTARLERSLRSMLPGDRQKAGIKPLRHWLTTLFGPVE